MFPRLLTFLVSPAIGLGASFAIAPLAAGILPPEETVSAVVQALEVPKAKASEAEKIETMTATPPSEDVSDEAARIAHAISGLGVFQKPVPGEDELLSRVLNLGQFSTRVEREGSRHSLSANFAFEFMSHEAALAAYDPTELMRLRESALSALVAAGQDTTVFRSGFSDREILRHVDRVVRAELPEVAAVHLVDLSLRGGPVRYAMAP